MTTNTGILNREIFTTKNGHTVELRTLSTGWVKIISEKFVNSYENADHGRHVANIVFMWRSLGCYACALDKVGRRYPDSCPHECGK
jgi:hypothetical protein